MNTRVIIIKNNLGLFSFSGKNQKERGFADGSFITEEILIGHWTGFFACTRSLNERRDAERPALGPTRLPFAQTIAREEMPKPLTSPQGRSATVVGDQAGWL
jgi:hypothetical protein